MTGSMNLMKQEKKIEMYYCEKIIIVLLNNKVKIKW